MILLFLLTWLYLWHVSSKQTETQKMIMRLAEGLDTRLPRS